MILGLELLQVISEGAYLRLLLRHGLRHQLVDLRAVIGHGHNEERFVVCEQHVEHRVSTDSSFIHTFYSTSWPDAPVATERTSTVLSLMIGLKMCLVSAVPARFLLWHFRISFSSCLCSSTKMSSSRSV